MKSSKLYTKKNKKTHVTKNKSIKKTNKVYKKKTKRIKKKQHTKKGGANSVNNKSKIKELIDKLIQREYSYSELLKYTKKIKEQIDKLIENLKEKQTDRRLNKLESKLLKLYEEKCNEIKISIDALLGKFYNDEPLDIDSDLEKQIKELLKLIIKYMPAVEKILGIEIILFQIPTRIELLINQKVNKQKKINELFPQVLKSEIIEEIDKRLESSKEAKEKEYLQKIKEKLSKFNIYDIEAIETQLETQLEIAQRINKEFNAYLRENPQYDYKTGLFQMKSRRRLSSEINNNIERGNRGTQQKYNLTPFEIRALPTVEV